MRLIDEHLASVPSDTSHYCGHKTGLKYFENPDLSIKALYEDFFKFYMAKEKVNPKLAYVTYFKIFKNLSYGFNRPKTDICDFCAGCQQKLIANPNDACQTEFLLHKRKAAKRKAIRREFIEKAEKDPSYLVIEFDYAQNYPVPKLNVSSQFYKRLLWLYCFNVHVLLTAASPSCIASIWRAKGRKTQALLYL